MGNRLYCGTDTVPRTNHTPILGGTRRKIVNWRKGEHAQKQPKKNIFLKNHVFPLHCALKKHGVPTSNDDI